MRARAPGAARAACAGRGPQGRLPLRASLASWGGSGVAGGPIGVAAHTAPARHRGASRHRRGIVPCGPLRVLGHCPAGRSDEGVFPRPGGSADGGACAISADRGAGARPEGRPCRAVLRSGAARLLGSALYALRVISSGASDGYICAMGGLRPAFFRYAPLPDSDFCWSLKALMRTIISKLYTVHWRNAGVGDCASR